MIVEAFQRPDGMWSFRGIALLGVQQDPRAYPTCEAAVDAARNAYPDDAVSIVESETQEPPMTPSPIDKVSKPPTADSGAVEPSTEDQVDIANRVQEGIQKANAKSKADAPSRPAGGQPLDGNPMPEPDTEGGVFKPADDTPSVLPKRSGPDSR
ncbi:MAG: hypothetical protein ACN6P8_02380 [Achromobacter piechaudii]